MTGSASTGSSSGPQFRSGATPAQKAKAAVAVAMNAQPFTNYEPYLQPWSGTSVKNVTVTPSLITITLSGPGANGFTAAQTKLAVQELVWTAQAAIGQGTIPVKFVVAERLPEAVRDLPHRPDLQPPGTGPAV